MLPLSLRPQRGDRGAVWRVLEKKYRDRFAMIETEFASTNFLNWFVSLLTNRSQGEKIALEIDNPDGSDQTRLSVLRSVSQVRLYGYLMDAPTYEILDVFVEKLKDHGLCTIRYQNDRRARIVEIVPNTDQAAYAIVYRVFDLLKKLISSIQVGKQRGGLWDALTQIRASGDPNTISIFSDVASMDASTQPIMAQFYTLLLADIVDEKRLGPDRYLGFSSGHRQVRSKFGGERTVWVTALGLCLRAVSHARAGKEYNLADEFFGITIQAPPTVFESGRYDTTAEHTTTLSIITEWAIEEAERKLCQNGGVFEQGAFGDDQWLTVTSSSPEDRIKSAETVLTILATALRELGFVTETNLSVFVCEFLQQRAFCGALLPQSPRTSVYCDERSSTARRDPIDQLRTLHQVIYAAAQRTWAPENVVSLANAAWLAISTFRLRAGPVPAFWEPLVSGTRQVTYFTLPWCMPWVSPLNGVSPQLRLKGGVVVPASSALTTVGDAKTNFLYNMLATPEFIAKAMNVTPALTVKDIGLMFTSALSPMYVPHAMYLHGYRQIQRLSEDRELAIASDMRAMTSRLMATYDSSRLVRSYNSARKLFDTYGIVVQKSLAYYLQPAVRVQSIFDTAMPTQEEKDQLDVDFLRFLHSEKGAWSTLEKRLKAACVFFLPGSDVTPEYPDLGDFPLVPGYRRGSCYSMATALIGTCFSSTGSVTKLRSSLLATFGNQFDVDSLVELCAKVQPYSVTAYEALADVLGLQGSRRADLISILSRPGGLLNTSVYRSTVQPDHLFGLSGDVTPLKRILVRSASVRAQSEPLLLIMLRDYLFQSILVNHPRTYTPVVPALTLMRLEAPLLAKVVAGSKA
uniref:RNA-directed RNA polymerase n=1 Tax=Shenzhen reo-like virus 4 TaxID=2789382 RepID=A0A7T1GW14_9REOV|nr:hypothetical protein [Shenzhen reo-like virus 4]